MLERGGAGGRNCRVEHALAAPQHAVLKIGREVGSREPLPAVLAAERAAPHVVRVGAAGAEARRLKRLPFAPRGCEGIFAHELDLREIALDALRLDARPRGQGDPCKRRLAGGGGVGVE